MNEKTVEEVAGAVWRFFEAAADMAGEMEEGEEVRLVRLRLKRREVVVVPGKLCWG